MLTPSSHANGIPVHHSPDRLDDYINLFAQSVECSAGMRGIVYMTVPITSGYNQFLLMDELKCNAEEIKSNESYKARYKKDVLEANRRTAEAWCAQARSSFPGRVVLDPSPVYIIGFGQPDYYKLWDKVIRRYADTVIATPKWAFSMGSRKEVEMAISSKLKVVDLSGELFSVNDLIRQDEEARNELRSWGWNSDRIKASLPRLEFETNSNQRAHFALVNTHWEDVLRVICDDLINFLDSRNPAVYSAKGDDDRTRGNRDALQLWTDELQKYWQRTITAGLGHDKGLDRLELSSLAGVSVAMLRSVVRTCGNLTTHREMERPFWEKGKKSIVASIDYEDKHSLNEIDASVWTWIREEHRSMRKEHSEDNDDELTSEASKDSGGGWKAELWDVHLAYAKSHGLGTVEGRYHLGRFATAVLRMLESVVRVYGPIPRRIVRDVTRDEISKVQ